MSRSKHDRNTRHSYAVWYVYRGAISSDDVLAQFESAPERDEFCERINSTPGYGRGYWQPVTLASVAHRFDPRSFSTDAAHELEAVRTSRGKCVFYIHQRPGYQI